MPLWVPHHQLLEPSERGLEAEHFVSQAINSKKVVKSKKRSKKNEDEVWELDERIGIAKNETKNIPKTYGKAIITYIEKEREDFENVLKRLGIEYEDLIS
jgi:hypothetical protein